MLMYWASIFFTAYLWVSIFLIVKWRLEICKSRHPSRCSHSLEQLKDVRETGVAFKTNRQKEEQKREVQTSHAVQQKAQDDQVKGR